MLLLKEFVIHGKVGTFSAKPALKGQTRPKFPFRDSVYEADLRSNLFQKAVE